MNIIQTIHQSRPALIKFTGESIYAIYADDSDHDVFYHVSLDDESVNLHEDLSGEFGDEIADLILAEIEI